MKHNIRRNKAESYVKRYSDSNEYSTAHSNIAIYDVLVEIRNLLDESLPEKPMEVLVKAPRPAEDTAPSKGLDHAVTFHCSTESKDFLSVRKRIAGGYEFFGWIDEDETETIIHLTIEDAKRLAQAILDSI